MAIDPKHLPEDPKVLQQMAQDPMAELDREFTERNKIERLLRELLDAKRNRKSERLSTDQLALFAATWQARQAEPEGADVTNSHADDDKNAKPGTGEGVRMKKTSGRRPPSGPQLSVALFLMNGRSADEIVVFRVATDPEPEHAALNLDADCAILQTDARSPVRVNFLEM